MASNLLTNSRMSCARTCLRKHWFRYELGLTPAEDRVALKIGTAYHRMREAAAKGENPFKAIADLITDPYTLETVHRLFMGYDWRFEKEPLEMVATELAFEAAVLNPETGSPTPIWKSAGKIDGIVKLADGRLAVLEIKTTSEDIGPGSDYWARLRLDQQITGYFVAARDMGYDVQTVLYDVVYKPKIRPKKATPEEDRKYVKATGLLYANQRAADETPNEFGERMTDEIIAEPERYYMRVEIPRLESDIAEYREELWQQQLSLRQCQRSGHWFRNTNACVFPYRCDYLDICSEGFNQDTVPPGFIKLEDVHPELGRAAARVEQATQPEMNQS